MTKLVNEFVGSFSGYEIDGTIDNGIAVLTGYKEQFGGNAIVEYEQEAYDTSYIFNIFIKRPETDEERQVRIQKESEQKTFRDELEYKRYMELKEKFDKSEN